MRHLEKECGLSRKELYSVNSCYSKTDASYVLKLKTNYKPERIFSEVGTCRPRSREILSRGRDHNGS